MLDRFTIKSVLKGSVTFIPGCQWFKRKEGGGAKSARYCYAVWLRHLTLARLCGFHIHPDVVSELGPGDSIGAGLAAILSGSRIYLAFDIVPFTSLSGNLNLFDELVDLYRRRAPIPGDEEFPDLYPRLECYDFPAGLFPEDHLESALDERRIREIREILAKGKTHSNGLVDIRYVAPWNSAGQVEAGTVDMIFSQAVMEHVDDLRGAYEAMFRWLKPGGVISHEIDFKCHGTAASWNGHWAYSDRVWRIVRGRRTYFLNRQTCASHLDMIRRTGFEVVHVSRQECAPAIARVDLCRSLSWIGDDDFVTASAHVIAQKRTSRTDEHRNPI